MTDTAGAKTIDLKWFGTFSPKQIMWVLVAFFAALILTILGFGASCYCFGMLIIAVILYMIPKFFGVDNIKLLTLTGILFMIAALLIGGLITAPGVVNGNQDNPPDNDYFEGVVYTYENGGVSVTATMKEEANYDKVYFNYAEVVGISFGFTPGSALISSNEYFELTVTDGSVSGFIELSSDSLFICHLMTRDINDDGEEINNNDSGTTHTFLTGAFDGSITKLSLYGCLIGVSYIMIVFFMIMIFSAFMRNRMEKTRDRLEKEGRLYPQGHGRCDQCGSLVLPGEVNCRKCGAYIDRPEEMKPQKKDFFECSECGAEVPKDAKECPKCGEEFDDDEFEITHADGTTETTNETFECSECGAEVPAAATFCSKCGAKFDNESE